jgi:hypothetical protein
MEVDVAWNITSKRHVMLYITYMWDFPWHKVACNLLKLYTYFFFNYTFWPDRLCNLVVRVLGYRSRCCEFDSRRYQIYWEVVGLERGPLSLVRIIEELLERTVAAPVYKAEINGRGNSLRWPRNTLCPLKLALISPTSGGRSVGIVRWLTEPRSFFICFGLICHPQFDDSFLLHLHVFSIIGQFLY